MEFNNFSIALLISNSIFIVLTIYTFFQYKIKKSNALNLQETIKVLENEINEAESKLKFINDEYQEKNSNLKYLIELEKREIEIKHNLEINQDELKNLSQQVENKSIEADNLNSDLESIKKDISIFEPKLNIINIGYFEEPEYLFETSDRFKEEIKIIREKQKSMIKENMPLRYLVWVAGKMFGILNSNLAPIK